MRLTLLPPPPAQDIIIIGGTGDLARRKLLPALYNLYIDGLLPPEGEIIALARTDVGEEQFKRLAHDAVKTYSRRGIDEDKWAEFEQRHHFHPLNEHGYRKLVELCHQRERLIYLAVPPASVPDIVKKLGTNNLDVGARLIIEKPFGTDLKSATALNYELHQVFTESQIFRIDHYLGKETVQNLLVFRFGNAVFERIWDRDAIDHVQITIAEAIGIEGRGAFYEGVGALRDIIQNHALQMLALFAMEPPAAFDAEAIRDEKAKLLRAIRPIDPANVVRGQYTAGTIEVTDVVGYREEPGVAPDSQTETFVALKLEIDNWRWAGVPIYLRAGKRLPYRATEAELAYKDVPTSHFEGTGMGYLHPNHLNHRIQPEERITFQFLTKVPGPSVDVKQVAMSFSYGDAFMVEPAEAYERLLHDTLLGDHTLFVREDAVEYAWRVVQPIIDKPPPLHFYPAGSWGPEEAKALVAPSEWHLR